MAGKIEYIYTDASFSHKSKIGGFAVIAPSWFEKYKGRWLSRVKVKKSHDTKNNCVIFYSACKCSDSTDSERRALGLAFIAACDMLSFREDIRVEIISDNLEVLTGVIENSGSDKITKLLSRIRKHKNIIISKVKAHNGHSGNELADKWAKHARKSQEENLNMRMPFKSNNNNNSFSNSNRRSNPFDGAAEMDIKTLTERVLNDENNIGYVTPEGKVMPRNMAFGSGTRNGIELVKQRIWGNFCDDDFIIDDLDERDEIGEADSDYPVNIIYSDEALDLIARESLSSPNTETGGALIGTWQRDPDGYIKINIERATGPGTEAIRNAGLFSPHMDYYRSRIAYYRNHNNWDYLGEWHKHPGNFDSLSSTDTDTARDLINEEGWPLLLLPIVNKVDGRFTIENNIILSPQLGGEIMTHINSIELDEIIDEHEEVTAFFDSGIIKNFRSGNKDSEVIEGFCNPGESYIFLDVPGTKNSAAKLIRDNGQELPVSGLDNVVTVIVNDSEIRCYNSHEGEINIIKHALIDPDSTIYERNAGLTETKILHDKTITIIGCGSLGSTIALSLARAGAGSFNLFDPDKLSPVNISRHQAGIIHLGRNKSEVVSDLIHAINPYISVKTFAFDIVNSPEGYDKFVECAGSSDIIICTTDTDDSRMLVNEFAVENKIKAVQAGLHERASSGIVHVYEPESDEACFACHRDNILSESSKRNENIAYSEAVDVRDLTIQPGLSAQINLVAEIAALRVIDALMDRKSLPGLTLAFIDDNSERSLSLNIRHLELARVDSCHVCSESESESENNNQEEY